MDYVHVELKRDTWVQPEIMVVNPDDAVRAVKKLTKNLDREMLVSIHMAPSGRVISSEICAIGSMDRAFLSPAEILRTALLAGAKNLILVHNHPSGVCLPSEQDLKATKRMVYASEMVGLNLLDHIVVGDNGSQYSIRQMHEELFDTEGSF